MLKGPLGNSHGTVASGESKGRVVVQEFLLSRQWHVIPVQQLVQEWNRCTSRNLFSLALDPRCKDFKRIQL